MVSSFAAKEKTMKLRLTSEGKRQYDERVVVMLERHVREQRGSAAIVLKQPALRQRLLDPRVG
jgi:hypothetical protein